MPQFSTCFIYGALDFSGLGSMGAGDFVFGLKTVTGFFVTHELNVADPKVVAGWNE